MSIVRNELRLLRHDPVPAAVLVGMPLVLMTLLSDAMESTLADRGLPRARRAPRRPCPGMACVFASFAIAVVGFAIFREHGWRTWPRLRAAGLSGRRCSAGKLAVPGGCWSPPSTSCCSASACCSWTCASRARGSRSC